MDGKISQTKVKVKELENEHSQQSDAASSVRERGSSAQNDVNAILAVRLCVSVNETTSQLANVSQ